MGLAEGREMEGEESCRHERKVTLCGPNPSSDYIRASMPQIFLGSNKVLMISFENFLCSEESWVLGIITEALISPE